MVLKGLPTDVILGQDFMNKHQNINIRIDGAQPTLHLGLKILTPVLLFPHFKSE